MGPLPNPYLCGPTAPCSAPPGIVVPVGGWECRVLSVQYTDLSGMWIDTDLRVQRDIRGLVYTDLGITCSQFNVQYTELDLS